jgi:hypothetical protein
MDAATREELERRNPVDDLVHQLALGGDRRQVVIEAKQTLNEAFDPGDITRLLLLPYYRIRIWLRGERPCRLLRQKQ